MSRWNAWQGPSWAAWLAAAVAAVFRPARQGRTLAASSPPRAAVGPPRASLESQLASLERELVEYASRTLAKDGERNELS